MFPLGKHFDVDYTLRIQAETACSTSNPSCKYSSAVSVLLFVDANIVCVCVLVGSKQKLRLIAETELSCVVHCGLMWMCVCMARERQPMSWTLELRMGFVTRIVDAVAVAYYKLHYIQENANEMVEWIAITND